MERGGIVNMLKVLVTDILLGSVNAEKINDPQLINNARKGFLHALAVASYLSKKHDKYAFVVATDEMWRGIVISHSPSGQAEDNDINFCEVELGIIVGCNSSNDIWKWPQDPKIKLYLLDNAEIERYAGNVSTIKPIIVGDK